MMLLVTIQLILATIFVLLANTANQLQICRASEHTKQQPPTPPPPPLVSNTNTNHQDDHSKLNINLVELQDQHQYSKQQQQQPPPPPPPRQQPTQDSSAPQSVVTLSEKFVDDGDAKFDLSCPLKDLIIARQTVIEPSQKALMRRLKQQIIDKVHVTWLKDGWPFWRENGNHVQKLNNYTLVLYTIRESDGGEYTCLVNYTNVPGDLMKHFNVNYGATYTLIVTSHGLPDVKPTISHPPGEFVTARGNNILFTCHSSVTLSHQTTHWYRSCPFPKDKDCIQRFLANFERARRFETLKPLINNTIANHHEDTLTLNNVTENQTGYYVCAVSNSRGIDIRLGTLELIDTWLKTQAEKGNVESILSPSSHHHNHDNNSDWKWLLLGICAFLVVAAFVIGSIYLFKVSIKQDKKQTNSLVSSKLEAGTGDKLSANLRQHLPNIDYPDIYNIGKTADGFISGHLHQDTGHLLSQSICSNILNKEKNLSISSSQHSDEASSSWGKSMSSTGDNCRAFYLHTSNTTATTVPMYDHPSSSGTLLRPFGTFTTQDVCVSNPTYGFLRPENDTTDWAFPRRNLDRLNKIGEGQFGVVWRYIARQKDGSGDIVAVKQLKNRAGLGDRERLELIAEIEIMKLVNDHPNVIKLLHYCVDEYEPILLIMEYAEHGKLQDYLRSCRASKKLYGGCIQTDEINPRVSSKDLIKFTYHIAKGMEYVASRGIVHRDLASRNILVSKDKVCKVADFGFARRVNDDCAYERTTANPVPVKWMAPEALAENKFTSKSDVFSLGIIMWEIVTLGATPYEQLTSEGVYKKVTSGGRLERPSHCKDEFYSLMAQCWQHDPVKRPTFREVACQLEKLLLSENNYIELDQYPEHAYYNIKINADEREVVNLTN